MTDVVFDGESIFSFSQINADVVAWYEFECEENMTENSQLCEEALQNKTFPVGELSCTLTCGHGVKYLFDITDKAYKSGHDLIYLQTNTMIGDM